VQVNFHIAGNRRPVTNLNQRPEKIRTTFQIAEARMKHANGLAVQRPELGALNALMLPDGLK
jgi:hypothetical protein